MSAVSKVMFTYDLQAFNYRDHRIVSDGRTAKDTLNLLVDRFDNVMSYLPPVAYWRLRREYDIVEDLESDQTIVRIHARGWIWQRSDRTNWVLP